MAGKIFIVGIGPGSLAYLTEQAKEAIAAAGIIVGYRLYTGLISELCGSRQVISNGMMQEEERARQVLQLAEEGHTVALVCSGDAGVYGMAGLIFEMMEQLAVNPEVEVIPGITSILTAAAAFGAPLMQDFAVISLSDLLTPWEKIQKRLHAAGEGDFVVGIYNPRSKQRQTQLVTAQEILLQYRDPATPAGILWNGTRAGERRLVTTLRQIPIDEVDMFATLIIGNRESYISHGRIVTPRGYMERRRTKGSSR